MEKVVDPCVIGTPDVSINSQFPLPLHYCQNVAALDLEQDGSG